MLPTRAMVCCAGSSQQTAVLDAPWVLLELQLTAWVSAVHSHRPKLIPLFGQEVAAWRCCRSRRLDHRGGMKGEFD